MNIQWVSALDKISHSSHYLVFAEIGFSALSVLAEQHGIRHEVVAQFADEVNRRNEVGTLLPLGAPISAIPRAAIRESTDARAVAQHILDFFDGMGSNGADVDKVIIDFCTPHLDIHAQAGIRAALEQILERPSQRVRELLVLDA